MQILPATAYYLAQLSGGRTLHGERPRHTERERGVWQLLPALSARPLPRQRDARHRRLQRRPGERGPLGGTGQASGKELSVEEIPFPETREYVQRVLSAQQTYRSDYAQQLGDRLRTWRRPATGYCRCTAQHARLQARLHLHADGRSAQGDRLDRRRDPERRALPDAARGDRDGQDDDDGRGDPGRPATDAGDRPQQDARGPALQRVPHLLPGQRGRVLRLLLRLLPARGLRPEPRPLHREGLRHQPGGRPPAPRRDGGRVRPPRRDRGRLGLLHLRPRLPGDLRDEHADPQARGDGGPGRAAAQTGLHPVHPQRHGALARDIPRPRRHARGVPRLRGERLPGDAVRGRGRTAAAVRPADRRADRGRARARRDLAGHPLQRQGGHASTRPSPRSAAS